MISGTLTNIYKKIEEAGVSGLRKTQLVKEFGKDAPKQLEELISQGMIYSAKKRNSILYWTKDNYNTNKETPKASKESQATKPKKSSNLSTKHISEQDATVIADMEKKIKDVYTMLNSINERISSDKTRDLIDALNSKLESLKKEVNTSLTNKLGAVNERIDTLAKEQSDNDQKITDNIDKKLSSINNKIDALTKAIESKVDSNKIVEIEKSLSNSITSMKNIEKDLVNNINKQYTTIIKDIETKIDVLSKSIEKKVDSNKLVELEKSLNANITDVKKLEKNIKNNINKEYATQLNDINNKIDALTKAIESKVDSNKIVEIEKSLNDIVKNELKSHLTNIKTVSDNIKRLEKNAQILKEELSNKIDTKSLAKLNEGMTKLEYNVNVLNSKLESLKKEVNTSLTNKLGAVNERIDTLAKEQSDNDQKITDNIDKKLSSINNKIDALTKAIESKVDSNKIVEIEKSLSKNSNKIDTLDKNISSISKNANERLDRLLRQISGKADDIKVFEMERKLESLLQVEAKLSSLENTINLLDGRINEVREEMSKSTAIIRAELQTISNGNGNGIQDYDTLSLEQFKMEFDRTIAESSTSIGWIELADIRSRICEKYGISKNTFYSLVSQLLDTYDEIYELSSGGSEGVMVRGLVHGFIRRI